MKTGTDDAEACQYIIALIYERCRIKLHEGKEALIRARLGKRLRHYGFASLSEYCDFLRNGAADDEFTRVVDALTTNFTNFLREADHFDFLVQTALPAVLPPGSRKIRIWSAASSTGEEPFSIAFHLAEHYPADEGWDWHVTATDVSTKVLEKARLAIYSEDRIKSIPLEWLRKYFQRGSGSWEGNFRVKPELARRVEFRQLNLTRPYSHVQPFQVIFCRNVMIYFERATQEQLVRQLCHFLVPGGCLMIGHSESLNGFDVPLRCVRPSIYEMKRA